jgi:hypothetical protein
MPAFPVVVVPRERVPCAADAQRRPLVNVALRHGLLAHERKRLDVDSFGAGLDFQTLGELRRRARKHDIE